ncbi:MAG: GAF domain-containing sensor histidine kinase [Pseudomonadota bacterium]
MAKEIAEENLDHNPYSLNEDDKRLLLKQSIQQISSPSFLCQIEPENPNFLEIIECNEQFLKNFALEKIEVIGNNYDFLLQGEDVEYGSNNYFEYINLIKAVKSLQVTNIKVSIPYPKDKNKIEEFKVSFVPSRYKTRNIYCVFSFEQLAKNAQEENDGTHSIALIQNLERAIRNERMLRSISDLIASEANLKGIAQTIVKTMCEYLKVDRCMLYDCDNGDSGFVVEHCTKGTQKISEAGDIKNPESPIARYIEFQNQLFLDINRLKKTTTMTVYEDVKNDPKFKVIENVCDHFGIGSQIVVIMITNDTISGGFYLQQSAKRSWLLEESELINIIASQFSMAIDRANYTHKLLISNQELLEKSNKLAESLVQEKRMRELQSEFVALVSHEFKTPLQIIDGARELVMRKFKTINIADEVIDKSLDRIKSAIVRMSNLIQSNLNLSKIEIGEEGIKVNKQNFDIKALVQDIVEKNFNLAQEKHINIEINVDNFPDAYLGDQKLLDHSFTNIITNAIKYSKANSVVKISGAIKENKLFLKVADNGIGIPKDDLDRIGKKFFRAKNTLSVAGTGIGLYLTKYFIELHGGSVLIESELDVGTTITAFLPIAN